MVPSWKEKRACLRAKLFPFRTLRLAQTTFSGLTSPSYRTFNLFGYRMSVDVARSSAQQLLFLHREQMLEDRQLITRLIKPGMRIIDVGANIGYYMLMFRHLVGEQGEVICVEPSPENLIELRKNITENPFTNIELHEVAIGSEEGTVSVRGGINSGVVKDGAGIASVELRTLDSLTESAVDFVKIDVDGYEGQVLEGALPLLRRDHPILYLEVHPHMIPRFGYSVRKLLNLIEPIYDSIETWEVLAPEKLSWPAKLSQRLLKTDPMVRLENPEELYTLSDQGLRNRTFWWICR